MQCGRDRFYLCMIRKDYLAHPEKIQSTVNALKREPTIPWSGPNIPEMVDSFLQMTLTMFDCQEEARGLLLSGPIYAVQESTLKTLKKQKVLDVSKKCATQTQALSISLLRPKAGEPKWRSIHWDFTKENQAQQVLGSCAVGGLPEESPLAGDCLRRRPSSAEKFPGSGAGVSLDTAGMTGVVNLEHPQAPLAGL